MRSLRLLVLVVLIVSTGGAAAAFATGSLPDGSQRRAGSHDFRFPGADTVALAGTDRYITYGASVHGYHLPFAISGHGATVGTSATIAGDALPGGGGSWTKPHTGIWSPGVAYHARGGIGRYFLFYTAVVAGKSGRRCIGVASSTDAQSGFTTSAKPLLCPAKGDRWALDADVSQGPGGSVWLTWRDGQRARGPESAISAAELRLTKNGAAHLTSTPEVIMRSDSLPWAHWHDGNGVTVIENPSTIFRKGSWYLFYSGNKWQTNDYATGIAWCGKTLNDGACTPMPNRNRAYFAYSGKGQHLPAKYRYRGLPGNHRGPGAMAVYPASDGKPWVTWNYLAGHGRRSTTGRLHVTGKGRAASFRVTG